MKQAEKVDPTIEAGDQPCAEVHKGSVEVEESEGAAGLELHAQAVHVAEPGAFRSVDDIRLGPRGPAGDGLDLDHREHPVVARDVPVRRQPLTRLVVRVRDVDLFF